MNIGVNLFFPHALVGEVSYNRYVAVTTYAFWKTQIVVILK